MKLLLLLSWLLVFGPLMASFNYNEGVLQIQNRTLDYAGGTIKARLVASSVTPNKDDTAMTGYTAIGTDQTLASKAIAKDTTNDIVTFTCGVITWTAVASGSTVGFVVFYLDGANDAARVPIACIDVTDLPTNGSDITYTPHATNKAFYLQQ